MRRLAVRTLIVVVLVAAAAIVVVLFRTGAFAPSLHDKLEKVAKGTQPAWYLGDRLDDLKLTGAATGKARRIASFGYGSCRHHGGARWNPFGNPTCGYPLLVQTWRLDADTPVNADFIPKLGDGTCARTTLRGVPAAVGTDGVVLYTGAEAIGVLGPAELVRRAVAALRPVAPGAPSVLPAPNTQPRAALADCRSVPGPFEPVTGRLRRLLKSSGLPLVTAGTWFQDAQLTNAEQVGRSVSLDYESCRLGSALAACASTLSITVEPVNRSVVMSDLRGAKCTRFSVGGAPGVVWNNQLPSGDAAGVYLFAGGATVATGRDFTLEHVDPGKIRRAARALRPLGAGALPKPSFDAGRLVGLCAKTS